MGLFDERIAYKPFEYPVYYTEGWLKQAQAFWLHTEISMQSDIKDWNEKLTPKRKKSCWKHFTWLRSDRMCSVRLLDPKSGILVSQASNKTNGYDVW